MISKGRLLLFSLFLSLLVSCPQKTQTVSDRVFRALDFTAPLPNNNYEYYDVPALRIAVGDWCEIYIEVGQSISNKDLFNLMKTFDTVIFPLVRDSFAPAVDESGRLAPWVDINADNRIAILLLDIRDGYTENSGYIGGYFSSTDFSAGNDMDILYIDINPGEIGSSEFYGTIAHELQHLTNYAYSAAHLSRPMQALWINEGLSSAAEYLYLGAFDWRIAWYSDHGQRFYNNQESEIPLGNNFYVWHGEREQDNSTATLDNYATVYLFFQWLRIQASHSSLYTENDDGRRVYKDLFSASNGDHRSVVSLASSKIDGNLDSWEKLLEAWHLANILGDDEGLHGYFGEAVFRDYYKESAAVPWQLLSLDPDMPVFRYNGTQNRALLYPGEGIRFEGVNNFTPSPVPSGINYCSIDENGNITTGSSYSGTLLVFNSAIKGSNSELLAVGTEVSIPQGTGPVYPSALPPARKAGSSERKRPRVRRVHPGYGN